MQGVARKETKKKKNLIQRNQKVFGWKLFYLTTSPCCISPTAESMELPLWNTLKNYEKLDRVKNANPLVALIHSCTNNLGDP